MAKMLRQSDKLRRPKKLDVRNSSLQIIGHLIQARVMICLRKCAVCLN